jgi:hypothetical protein
MKEEEAREKRCPAAQIARMLHGIGTRVAIMDIWEHDGRKQAEEYAVNSTPKDENCIASDCAWWVTTDKRRCTASTQRRLRHRLIRRGL